MNHVVIAKGFGRVKVNGMTYILRKNVTTAHSEHSVVKDYPHLWGEIKVDFPVDEEPLNEEYEPTVKTGLDMTAVREWAKANGLDVSDKGRVKDSVVRQYREAHYLRGF